MPLSRTRRLLCPKCGTTFDYDFVPGASFTAFRLGNARYMRCPICHKFSTFKMTGPDASALPPTTASVTGTPPPPG